MHALGKSLGETVCQRLDEDGRVVVIRALETLGNRHFLDTRRHHEAADIIGNAAIGRGDEIGKRYIRTAVTLGKLLAQREEGRQFFFTAFVRKQPDIVAHGIGRPEADHRARPNHFSSIIFASIACASA